MSLVGQRERATQDRVIALFRNELGYRYLGNWTDRDDNSNVEEGLLSTWLTGRGYAPAQISAALHKLRTSRQGPQDRPQQKVRGTHNLRQANDLRPRRPS